MYLPRTKTQMIWTRIKALPRYYDDKVKSRLRGDGHRHRLSRLACSIRAILPLLSALSLGFDRGSETMWRQKTFVALIVRTEQLRVCALDVHFLFRLSFIFLCASLPSKT